MNTPLAFIGNLAGADLLIILVIMLLLFGAKKLPELAKGMGQAVKEFNKAKDEFEREISKPVQEMTVQQPRQVLPQTVTEPMPTTAAAPAPAAAEATVIRPVPVPSETLPS